MLLLQPAFLVVERSAVNAVPSRPVAFDDIASLAYEALHDSVEPRPGTASINKRLAATLAFPSITLYEGDKIGDRLRRIGVVQRRHNPSRKQWRGPGQHERPPLCPRRVPVVEVA